MTADKWHWGKGDKSRRCPAEIQCRLGGEHFNTSAECQQYIESELINRHGLMPAAISKKEEFTETINAIKNIPKVIKRTIPELDSRLEDRKEFVKKWTDFARKINPSVKISGLNNPLINKEAIEVQLKTLKKVSDLYPQYKKFISEISFEIMEDSTNAYVERLKYDRRFSKIAFSDNHYYRTETAENWNHRDEENISKLEFTVYHEFAHIIDNANNEKLGKLYYEQIVKPAILKNMTEEELNKYDLNEVKHLIDKYNKDLEDVQFKSDIDAIKFVGLMKLADAIFGNIYTRDDKDIGQMENVVDFFQIRVIKKLFLKVVRHQIL